MATVKCFVHKQTPEQLKDHGAVIWGIDKVSCTHIYILNKLIFMPIHIYNKTFLTTEFSVP